MITYYGSIELHFCYNQNSKEGTHSSDNSLVIKISWKKNWKGVADAASDVERKDSIKRKNKKKTEGERKT